MIKKHLCFFKTFPIDILISLLCLCLFIFISGCDNSAGNDHDATGSVSFQIQWPVDSSNSGTLDMLVSAAERVTVSEDCSARGVATIMVVVRDSYENLLVQEEFSCDLGVGTMSVPVGSGRMFIISSLDSDGYERYHGEKTGITILVGSNDIGIIQMERNSEFCTDNDGDGYYAESDCGTEIDCDDNDADVYPDAVETCDGKDNDCDGSIDEDKICQTCTDNDGDGYYLESECGTQFDCNDSDASIHPGAAEVCGDGIDQDCNGNDLICPDDVDDDGDGQTENQGDCDDTDATIFDGATEICGDGIDQDCDRSDLPCSPDPEDVDDDGDGQTENQGDCDDTDATIFNGATEVCDDDKDNNCDGNIDCNDSDCIDTEYCKDCTDNDSDGYYAEEDCEGEKDCDDNDPNINPGVNEICDDGIDNNCDNKIDMCDWVGLDSPASVYGWDLYDVDFTTPENGWVVGGNGGIVLKTINGGNSWEKWSPDLATTFIFNGVDFVDENVGVIVGTDRHIYKTVNGGNSWSKHDFSKYSDYNPDYYYHFTSITALSSTEAWITGYAQKKDEWQSSGYIRLHTTNGGDDWQKHAYAYEGATLNDCFFLNENEGWMIGDRGFIIHTSNGGQNWDLRVNNDFIDDNMTGSIRYHFESVYFTTSTEGWVTGWREIINTFSGRWPVMFHTVDGGTTWNNALPVPDDDWWGGSINSIDFGPTTTAWAVGQTIGSNNNVLRSDINGINWSIGYSCPSDTILNSVKLIGSEGWAVGLDGIILHYPGKCPM